MIDVETHIRIKMLSALLIAPNGHARRLCSGMVYEFDADFARDLIDDGYAVRVELAPAERIIDQRPTGTGEATRRVKMLHNCYAVPGLALSRETVYDLSEEQANAMIADGLAAPTTEPANTYRPHGESNAALLERGIPSGPNVPCPCHPPTNEAA